LSLDEYVAAERQLHVELDRANTRLYESGLTSGSGDMIAGTVLQKVRRKSGDEKEHR